MPSWKELAVGRQDTSRLGQYVRSPRPSVKQDLPQVWFSKKLSTQKSTQVLTYMNQKQRGWSCVTSAGFWTCPMPSCLSSNICHLSWGLALLLLGQEMWTLEIE